MPDDYVILSERERDRLAPSLSPDIWGPREPKGEPPIRAAILDEAKQAVCSDRNAEYGEPIDNFGRWAGVCNALGYRGPGGRELKPHDLAVIATGGKLCRVMQTPDKRDHSVDTAGYGSLIYELVTLEG